MRELFAHEDINGIERYSFPDIDKIDGKISHVAVHVIGDDYAYEEKRHYVQLHRHDFDEIIIMVPSNGSFKFMTELDGRMELIDSPALIHIPAGTEHRAEAICGNGVLVCIHMDRRLPAT